MEYLLSVNHTLERGISRFSHVYTSKSTVLLLFSRAQWALGYRLTSYEQRESPGHCVRGRFDSFVLESKKSTPLISIEHFYKYFARVLNLLRRKYLIFLSFPIDV